MRARTLPHSDASSVLAESTRYLLHSLRLVGAADLAAPTPCRCWDLGRLLRHVRASLADVTDVLAGRDPGRQPDPASGDDPVAALRAGIVDLLLASASVPAADGPCRIRDRSLPANLVVYVGAIESALHAWDIAQACRVDHPIPAEIASALLCVSPPLAQAGLAGHVFDEPLAAPAAATPGDRLLALFGRRRPLA